MCLYRAQSQDSTISKKIVYGKTYTVKVKTTDGERFGYLTGFSDSAVLISRRRIRFSRIINREAKLEAILFSDIKKIGFRVKGRVSKGMWIGALAGMAVGIGIASVTYEKPSSGPGMDMGLGAGLAAVGGASIGFFSGMIIGGSLRSKRIKFNIEGSFENFTRMRNLILNQ